MKVASYDEVMGILEASPTMSGTYVAVKWSDDTGANIKRYFEGSGVPNMLEVDEYHSTLAYSKVKFNHKINEQKFSAGTKGLRIFEDQRNKKKVLVMELVSKDLTERHSKIHTDNPKAHYGFPEYIPHLTLSYDVSGMDKEKLKYLLSESFGKNELQEQFESIGGGKEYTETLDLNKNK